MTNSLDTSSELKNSDELHVTKKNAILVKENSNGTLSCSSDFSADVAKEDALTTTSPNTLLDDSKKGSFYKLKYQRKGLKFQSVKKNKMGLFEVTVRVDHVKYYGVGPTQSRANDICSAGVLAAFESGEHEKRAQELQKEAFNTLNKMYQDLFYRAYDTSDNKYCVHVNVEGVDYFGEGQTEQEAIDDTAWSAMKSIWDGDHKKKLDELDEYWYDLESFDSTLYCVCSCHYCDCCSY